MTISRATRGALTGVAAALIAVFPVAMTPATAAPNIAIAHQAPIGADFKLQGAPNARDIGGVSAQNGKIKAGLVYRADALNRLTDADQSTLTAAGITKIIDFRSPTERAANPDKTPASIQTVQLPVYDPNNDFYVFFGKLVQSGPAAQQAALGDGKGAQYMRDYYKWMVTDPTSRTQFGSALQEIATTSGSVLYHCTAGKDRTGLMTAYLMTILGTPQDQIFGNFLASNDRLAASNKATLDALVAQGLVTDRTLFEPVLGVQKDYLEAALTQAVASYGSMNDYISKGLGIDSSTYKLLQDKLIEKGGISTGSFGN